MLKEKFIEEFVLSSGLVKADQIEEAKHEMKLAGIGFKAALEKLDILSEEKLTRSLAESLGIPYVDISNYLFDPEMMKVIPEKLVRKYKLIPLYTLKDTITLAMVDPQDVVAIDEVRALSKFKIIRPVFATESAIEHVIDQYYAVTGGVDEIVEKIGREKLEGRADEIDEKRLVEMAEEAPVIKVMNMIIMKAVKQRASDIHIEPQELILGIRYRIDGVLRQINDLPKHLHSLLVSRIKVMAQLDIAEKRKPQDGKVRLKMENKDLDLRISTLPTNYGENVVIRILDKSALFLSLSDIGMSKHVLTKFDTLIHKSYGIILVTGPTGSGKTTTLYAALSKINSIEKNIITVEDPIEYQIPLVRQTQVNVKAGYTFASGLRSMLRQDPDIIMVGEIRDQETADIAMRAALTGHLVFSTLHTNDAPSAFVRLVDMGVAPFLVSSSVIGVLAQRLVRVICSNCKEKYTATVEELVSLGLPQDQKVELHRGKGCKKCSDTGYSGRIGIYELVGMTDNLVKPVMDQESSEMIKQIAIKNGMKTLREDAVDKVLKGITTVSEALRATQEL